MKKTLLFLITFLVASVAMAQGPTQPVPSLSKGLGDKYQMVYFPGWARFDSGFVFPDVDASKSVAGAAFNKPGRAYFDRLGDSTLHIYTGKEVLKMLSTKDSALIKTWIGASGQGGIDSITLADSMRVVRLLIPDTTFLHNNFSNYLRIMSGGGIDGLTRDLDANGFHFTDGNTPTAPSHLVNKQYADALASGFRWTASAKVATASQLSGAYTYNVNYPYTITFDNPGLCPLVDGYRPGLHDLVLVKDEVGDDSIVNGLYEVADPGGVSANCVMVRESTTNTSFLIQHAAVPIDTAFGTVNRGGAFIQTHANVVLNTTGISFTRFNFVFYSWAWGLINEGSAVRVDSSLVASRLRLKKVSDSLGAIAAAKQNALTLTTIGSSGPATLIGSTLNIPSYSGGGTYTATGYLGLLGTAFYLDTTAGKAATKTDLLSYYPLSNPLGFISSFTEADPIANAHTVRIGTNWGLTGGGAAQPLSTNPARDLGLDSAAVNQAVFNSLAVGAGLSKSGRTITNILPDQTVAITNVWGLNITGPYPNFSEGVDSGLVASKARVKKQIDSVAALIGSAGYISSGVVISVSSYSVAGVYVVTPPAVEKGCIVRGVGAGGGAGACVGVSSTAAAISGGGGAGAQFEHVYTNIGWSSGTLTLGAGGSAGAVTGCPSCVGANGGNGATSTWTDGTTTITIPGGNGSLTVVGTNQNRAYFPGAKSSPATGANKLNGEGSCGGFGWCFGVTATGLAGGAGADAGEWGKGGTAVGPSSNFAGNNGSGNGSGGGGCISGGGTGSSNSKNGGAGTDARVDYIWLK